MAQCGTYTCRRYRGVRARSFGWLADRTTTASAGVRSRTIRTRTLCAGPMYVVPPSTWPLTVRARDNGARGSTEGCRYLPNVLRTQEATDYEVTGTAYKVVYVRHWETKLERYCSGQMCWPPMLSCWQMTPVANVRCCVKRRRERRIQDRDGIRLLGLGRNPVVKSPGSEEYPRYAHAASSRCSACCPGGCGKARLDRTGGSSRCSLLED